METNCRRSPDTLSQLQQVNYPAMRSIPSSKSQSLPNHKTQPKQQLDNSSENQINQVNQIQGSGQNSSELSGQTLVRHGPGRPKGSKNKHDHDSIYSRVTKPFSYVSGFHALTQHLKMR